MTFTCEECNQATANWTCGHCGKSLCAICNATLHAKTGPNEHHQRKPMAQPKVSDALQELISAGRIVANAPAPTTTTPHQYSEPATVAAVEASLPKEKLVGLTESYLLPATRDDTNHIHFLQGMESLTSDLEEQMQNVGNPAWRPRCYSCRQVIPEGEIALKHTGRSFHEECFKCAKCGRQFQDTSFVEQGGKFYCPADHKLLFSTQCVACGGIIKNEMVTLDGKSYHPEHFKCKACEKPIVGSFSTHQGHPYCIADFTRLFSTKCAGCGEPAETETHLTFKDAKYHLRCFVCDTCKEPLGGGEHIRAYPVDGKPYCEQHYHEKNGHMCAACTKVIFGTAVTVRGTMYHVDCFTCTTCKKPLSGAYFEIDSLAYCAEDAEALKALTVAPSEAPSE